MLIVHRRLLSEHRIVTEFPLHSELIIVYPFLHRRYPSFHGRTLCGRRIHDGLRWPFDGILFRPKENQITKLLKVGGELVNAIARDRENLKAGRNNKHVRRVRMSY